jgi:hypothetical protein
MQKFMDHCLGGKDAPTSYFPAQNSDADFWQIR